MITFSIVKDSIIEKFKRVLKVEQYGAKTADVISSFGDDSAPLNDMIALYANTSEVGDSVIIGYINKNQIAQPGEKRVFSLKPDGTLSFDIHLKTDGTCEIGGAIDNAVRHSKLNTALQAEVTKINAELVKISAAVGAVGGSYVHVPVTVDIAAAKINEIKTL